MSLPRLCTLALLAALPALPAQVEGLGRITFPTSGSEAAQPHFVRGVLLLHSFEYEDAREAFVQTQQIDPGFAMAYWGEAMTHSHPIWRREYLGKGRAALAKLAATPAERRAKAPTDREKRWLACVESLFGAGERPARQRAFAATLTEMRAAYPDDLEVAAFSCLATLGTSTAGRDIPTYMRAAAIGEEVYRRNSEHPGALHYLIHSYDDPVHAPLGLRMARTYDRVAAAAAHARHMPSHIYVALGMWKESARSNESAVAAADARRARKKLDVDARGWHSIWWLAYTYLQLGRPADAARLLAEAERDCRTSGSVRIRRHLAVMQAAHLVETGDWNGPASRIAIDTNGVHRRTTCVDQFVRGMVALRRGDRERAGAILVQLSVDRLRGVTATAGGVAACCAPGGAMVIARGQTAKALDRTACYVATTLGLELEAEIRLAEGRTEEALRLLARATAVEDAMDFDFGPPPIVRPAHEMMGEVLLSLGREAQAAAEFEHALRRAPRRARSLLGLARALRGTDAARAKQTYAEVDEIWSGAERDLPARAEVERGAR